MQFRFTEAPSNNAPSNDDGSISNMDDSNNLRTYIAVSNHSDEDGYADVSYVYFNLAQSTTVRACFKYYEDVDSFSQVSGSTGFELVTGSCVATKSGNDVDLEWHFKVKWGATEEADLEVKLYIEDDDSASDTDTIQSDYCDVVKTLVTNSIECTDGDDPDRVDISSTVTVDFAVRYADDPGSGSASTLYPPDAEFTGISIYDSGDNNKGTDSSIVDGAGQVSFSGPASEGSEAYNLYVDMADADYGDGELSATETIVFDSLKIDSYSIDLANVKITLHLVYGSDSSDVVGGYLSYAGVELLTDGSGNAVMNSTNFPSSITHNTVAYALNGSYGITAIGLNQTVPAAYLRGHLIESDASISTLSGSSSSLSFTFSSSGTLKISGSKPVYVLGETYDFSTAYTTYLTLSHDIGSRTLQVVWASWGGLNVRGLTHEYLTSVSLSGNLLTLVVNGSSWSGSLYVDCTGRTGPQRTTGFTTESYNALTGLFTGGYTLSSNATLTLDWSTGGGSDGTTQLQIDVDETEANATQGGEGVPTTITLTWSGAVTLEVKSVTFSQHSEWFTITDSLPLYLDSDENPKTGIIPITIQVPASAPPGTYAEGFTLTCGAQGYNTVTVNGYIQLTVLEKQGPPIEPHKRSQA